jgi:hypothetical protein
LTGNAEWWKDGALVFDPEPFLISVRLSDQPFDGSSHRLPVSRHWNRGADNLGNYEYRSSWRDTEGNGWDIVAPFRIVAELTPGDFNQDGTVDAADYVVWRNIDNTQDAYDIWRANFGTSLLAGSGSAIPSAESLPAIPEPATLLIACIAAIGVGAAARRKTRQGVLQCAA